GQFSITIDISGIPDNLLNEKMIGLKDFTLVVDINDATQSLKSQIADMTGLTVSKQKLTVNKPFNDQLSQEIKNNTSGLVMKNGLTLAHYNLADGAILLLGIRERGGRR
ncbi:hypothetical protein BB561_002470, partial [Smittium simulii]